MARNLDIPPPLTEENKERYLEELSNFIEADDWIERHSIENQSNYGVNKSEHHHDAKTTFKEEPAKFYEVIIEVMIAYWSYNFTFCTIKSSFWVMSKFYALTFPCESGYILSISKIPLSQGAIVNGF